MTEFPGIIPGGGDLAREVDYSTEESGVYPIALVSYLIGCVEYEDANTAELVAAYFSYIASPEGQDAAAENAGSGYRPRAALASRRRVNQDSVQSR